MDSLPICLYYLSTNSKLSASLNFIFVPPEKPCCINSSTCFFQLLIIGKIISLPHAKNCTILVDHYKRGMIKARGNTFLIYQPRLENSPVLLISSILIPVIGAPKSSEISARIFGSL